MDSLVVEFVDFEAFLEDSIEEVNSSISPILKSKSKVKPLNSFFCSY